MEIAIVFAVVCGTVIVILVVVWWRKTELLDIRIEEGTNNDDAAVRHFLQLIGSAKSEILIHDEGDPSASLYQDEKIVEAMRERLEAKVMVRCLFNRSADLRMVNELRNESLFEVHYLRRPPPRNKDVHFKIVDRGKRAYLSRHLPDGRREYRMFDCTHVSRRARKRLFAPYLSEFQRGVEELSRL